MIETTVTPIFVGELWASSIGTDTNLLYLILGVISTIVIGIITYFWVGNILIASFTVFFCMTGLIYFQIIPWWIGIMGASFAFYKLLFNSNDKTKIMSEDEWVIYGNKLKFAYASKFGGENKGFNDEVDKRIVIMQHNKRGFTRTIAKDWLKHMQRFTEAK